MSVEIQSMNILGTRLVYRLRFSRRARNIRMSVSSTLGVEVTVPEGCSRREAQAFLVTRANWAIRHLQQLGLDPEDSISERLPRLPEQIHLKMSNDRWSVCYMARPQGKITLSEKPGRLVLSSPSEEHEAAIQVLQVWCKRQARALLGRRLYQLSCKTGLQYTDLRIKSQRTRWGSYSYVGRVNLNYLLIFLPPMFADYVILHELCHSKHANHSPAFWQLLETFCPGAKQLDQSLQARVKDVPLWAQYRAPVVRKQSVA